MLEPYAARLCWRFPEAQPVERWQALLAALLDELGQACTIAGPYTIGHIKGLALLPEGGFLRGSKVSSRYPADTEINGATIGFYTELEIAINVLIYGLPLAKAHSIVSEVSLALAQRWGAELEVLVANSHRHYHHNQIHDDS